MCLCGQMVVRGMMARGSGGSIVNVSSQASQRALREHTVYCESRAVDLQGPLDRGRVQVADRGVQYSYDQLFHLLTD